MELELTNKKKHRKLLKKKFILDLVIKSKDSLYKEGKKILH